MVHWTQILKYGNRDERCYINGHDWYSIPYYWNIKNGLYKRCKRCGEEVERDDLDPISGVLPSAYIRIDSKEKWI